MGQYDAFFLIRLWQTIFADKSSEEKEVPYRSIKFLGRCPSTASATGNKKQHENEFKCLIVGLFGELTEEEKAAIKAEEDAKIAAAKAKAAEKQKVAANKKAEVKAQSAKVQPEAPKKDEKGKPEDQTKLKDPPADQPKNKK